MSCLKKFAAGLFMALATNATVAAADDQETVQIFYDLLNNPGSEPHTAAFLEATAEGWVSTGDYSVKTKSRDAFVGQMGGFAKLIPDLEWTVQDMYQDGDTVVVRSRAIGTPAGPLFGVDGEGRGFDILTIDIHKLEGCVIVQSYHVEDRAGAMRQFSSK
ncbi:ester cyclase [Leisingera sp. S132]|uniref:ester cyclase n=1 Tax=Leisingera sp. S132 TaxID=2867016 RepID=UPI0021A833B6|nr:ester cyclase [Leisingera sp. S132]UWQ80375.1 ester cyclase [Leisingera sp. S132]